MINIKQTIMAEPFPTNYKTDWKYREIKTIFSRKTEAVWYKEDFPWLDYTKETMLERFKDQITFDGSEVVELPHIEFTFPGNYTKSEYFKSDNEMWNKYNLVKRVYETV